MRNIYIIDDYATSKINGIGSYIRELINCLKALGTNICLISFNCLQTDKFSICQDENMTVWKFPPITGFYLNYYIEVITFFKLYIKDSENNLFIVNHSPCEKFLKTLKCSFPKSKIAFVIHDMGWTEQLLGNVNKLKRIINTQETQDKYANLISYFQEEKRMYDIVDKVITLSNDTEQVLKSIYQVKDSKIFYCPNGKQDSFKKLTAKKISQFKSKLYISENEKIILFIGRICHIKGVYSLINCFKNVLKHYTNCRLVFVGSIFDSKPIELSSSISSKVTFTGHISSNEVNMWYNIADIGVLPSYYEQCSYTGIEMMMYELPIISSDGFSLQNMFINNKNAMVANIVDSNDSSLFETNLYSAFIKLLSSNELRKRLGKNARSYYLTHYNIDKMKDNYKKLFEEL